MHKKSRGITLSNENSIDNPLDLCYTKVYLYIYMESIVERRLTR